MVMSKGTTFYRRWFTKLSTARESRKMLEKKEGDLMISAFQEADPISRYVRAKALSQQIELTAATVAPSHCREEGQRKIRESPGESPAVLRNQWPTVV
jgi:hypothetical protein